MARLDRYILSQLLVLFGFFALVLVLIYWVNQAVRLFDQLISDGQTALVFLQLSALTLPGAINIVLPIAAFVAAVYLINRMSSDSELVVVQATGASPWRLARPVLVFGLIVGLFASVLSNLLVPLAGAALSERRSEIAENVTARLLTEGQFLDPSPGLTFYIREITPSGELRDVYLSDDRNAARRTTYTAERALLTRGPNGPTLLMFDGMAQSLTIETRRLAVTRFDSFTYDIGRLIEVSPPGPRSAFDVPSHEILTDRAAVADETGATPRRLDYVLADRVNEALLGVVAPLVALACLLVGGYSRFGSWRQITGAIVAILVIDGLDTWAGGLARSRAGAWPVTFVSSALGAAFVAGLLTVAARPGLLRPRPEAPS